MRVDAGAGPLPAGRQPQASAADRSADASFSAVLAATRAGDAGQADFTRMTRQAMRDWVDARIRSGEMSLDDSRPFMAMTMKIPVSGGLGGELAADRDGTRYDFTQKIRDGIRGARSRNDETTLKLLESALSILQRRQEQAMRGRGSVAPGQGCATDS